MVFTVTLRPRGASGELVLQVKAKDLFAAIFGLQYQFPGAEVLKVEEGWSQQDEAYQALEGQA